MSKYRNDQKGFSAVEVVLVVALIALIGFIGWLVYRNHHKTVKTITTTVQTTKPSSATSTNTSTNTNETYEDSDEKASFTYPTSWKLKSISFCGSLSCSDASHQVELTSPDSKISLTWIPGGPGGDADCSAIPFSSTSATNVSCAQLTVFSSTPIPGASGLYVVEGAYQDYYQAPYEPFMEVQDNNGNLVSGLNEVSDATTVPVDDGITQDFVITSSGDSKVFAMGSLTGNVADGTFLTYPSLAQAQVFFTSSDATQAKQILLSLELQ